MRPSPPSGLGWPGVSTPIRNVLIVLALAAIVWAVPGGGEGASVVGSLLSTAITALFVLFGVRLYRERRIDLFSLGDRHRVALYGSAAAILFALAGRQRFWETGVGGLLWLLLVIGGIYGLVAVYRYWRTYSF